MFGYRSGGCICDKNVVYGGLSGGLLVVDLLLRMQIESLLET